MENQEYRNTTIAQLVADQPGRAVVFEKWNLDYCCGGNVLIEAACAEKNVDAQAVINDLQQADLHATAPEINWWKAPLTALCENIVSVHHAYLREALPRLSYLTEKVSKVHGDEDARLFKLAEVFEKMRHDLDNHSMKEEERLFPAIKSLEKDANQLHFSKGLGEPVKALMAEHGETGAALVKIRELTDDFTAGLNSCNSHRAMLFGLQELEKDVHTHVHKENTILFPRALDLEKSLLATHA